MRTTRVVIIGSGFGGLAAAQRLAKRKIDTVLISSTDEHLFQPLLYQVATGVLPAAEIAPPISGIMADAKTVSTVRGTVVDVDADAKVVTYRGDDGDEKIGYEYLIVATGASQSYFGHDGWADRTFSLKTLDDAATLRAHLLETFAAPADDEASHTFVVVGAGATGVEVAGQIRELHTRHFTKVPTTVYLVEGADDVLPVYGGRLSSFTRKTLDKAGVQVLTGTVVTEIGDDAVTVRDADGNEETIATRTVVWSAGVQAAPLARTIAEATGCDTDRAGRLLINPDLTVGGRADVFAIGDMTSLNGYPGQSPVAMQEGRHAADTIAGRIPVGTGFHYVDKGSMAVINTHNAVVDGPFGFRMTGVPAWFAWLAIHLYYLVGHRNRLGAVWSWMRAFVGHARLGFDEAEATPAVVDDESAPAAQAA